MKRYDRYEDGIVIDNQKGENNLFELIRVDDMLEIGVESFKGVNYIKIHSEHMKQRIEKAESYKVYAIWFRSGNTMTRYALKGENE